MTRWENQPQPSPAIPPLQPLNHFGESGYTAASHDSAAAGEIDGALYVKVMTDEQLEVLRTQIAAYATITEQLAELHKAATSQQDLAGMRVENLYSDPMVTSVSHKFSARQRWTPTAVQLQILEKIFDEGIGTPNKQKIKEIVAACSQYGQISETNVYNWFQNRRARSKRKQLIPSAPNIADQSVVETEAKSPKEKITKPENFQSQHESATAEDYRYQQGQGTSSEIHSIDPQSSKVKTIFLSDECVKSSESLGQLAFYENVMEQSGLDYFMGKMEVPRNYSPYQSGENYSITG